MNKAGRKRGGQRPRTGQYFNCMVCGDQFYRRPSHVTRGITKTCGKRECISKSMMAENNPFWGKNRPPEVVDLIRTRKLSKRHNRKRKPKQKSHTPEGKARTAALRQRWITIRDKMTIDEDKKPHPYQQIPHEPRYRICFTRHHRKNWIADKCFYCHTTEDLILDHIIPVMAGGTNDKSNCQTLCGKCNRWKMRYVDLPYYLAKLGSERGQTS